VTSTAKVPASALPPALKELVRSFKPGYVVERTGAGHFRVRDPQGHLVTAPGGKNITLSGTAHGGRAINNMTAQLRNAGVLKPPPAQQTRGRTNDHEAVKKARASRTATLSLRSKNRQAVADALYERLHTQLVKIGVANMPGLGADLGHIGAMRARAIRVEGESPITPDLAMSNAYRVLQRNWVDSRYQELWGGIAAELEKAKDPSDAWFALVREARGLPRDVVEVRKPVDGGDWPFRVELLPIEALIVDHDYQRPVAWPFVRSLAATYDESLVGTIDVAERRHGAVYAILDGQLRYEASRLVGKQTVWASIYSGLDKSSEARFFLHKNKDKKAIHPYFTFRARLAAGDADALAIEKIVKRAGYVISITSANDKVPNAISAIAALEEAYGRKQDDGSDSLEPTLAVLSKSTLGMRHGQGHVLLRGLGIVFQHFGKKVDLERMRDTLAKSTPEVLQNRAREEGRHSSSNAGYAMARLLAFEYDRGLKNADKLGRI
jgi:hypothetical protein